jgi:hypothetical protein
MSLIPSGVSVAIAEALGLLQPIFLRTRSIGGFVANVTLEEHHLDEMRITDHPVERNAVISDHAFKLPMRVVIRVGYSNSSQEGDGDPNYVQEVYEQFLALQESRELIEILTGKRFYENMLIERLAVTTDEKTENALLMTCECREVIIVDTQVATTTPAADQKDPSATGATQKLGAVAAQPGTALNQTSADATLGNENRSLINTNTSIGTLGTQSFDTSKATEIPVATPHLTTTDAMQQSMIP